MVEDLLHSQPGILNFGIFFLLATVLLLVILGFVTYAILAERKVMGFIQLRQGPNQVGGRWGLLQTVADVLKLLLKEDTIPKLADKPLFILAPVIAFAPSFIVIAAIPFTDKLQFADLNIGLLYYIAISGLTTIGMVTGGWASNNELSDEDKLVVQRARRIQVFLSQNFHVAEQFTGQPGSYVPVKETVKGFKEILEGKYDHLPEDAFRLVGRIEDAIENAKQMGVEV